MIEDLERASKIILLKMDNVELSILLRIAGINDMPAERHEKANLLLDIIRRKS